ncbi:copper amine oxidase N-terminal domain-containing protein [Paenibacillus sp. KACC 21273]|uniref:copper amine oxidase N-terminal domain-containing protein n=1 Tax=Paenibacillus sp. KACC 21273 TaxID=3025665 RepID=UPI0023672186|nr:copper amine oxidase N-terminal domain-containing protein [Paenibacillus sp. KACC 21273]WDF51372.1 copper amine oxidase N-terminal domain-containing protein [Paenibacillus sp. KACC 21273]
MKKKIMTVLAATILFTGIGVNVPQVDAATNKPQIEVLLDARKMAFPDAKPFQDDSNAVMVPIRFVSEKLGAKVGWSKAGGKQIVTLKTDKHTVSMTVGSATAVVDGESKTYDSKIILKQSRTFVPLRLVSEGLGQTVNWDQIGKWVWIGNKEVPTIDELNLKKQSIEPYRTYFASMKNNFYFMKSHGKTPYTVVVNVKFNHLPAVTIDDVSIYSMELYTRGDVEYLKVRSTGSTNNILFLTAKGDGRYRMPREDMTKKNADGTEYNFYEIYSRADVDLDGIIDKKPLSIKDIKYINLLDASNTNLVLITNPWRN